MTCSKSAGSARGSVSNTERRQNVIDQLKRDIALGNLPLGSRVVEAEVCSRLGVSRPTVREALSQLARNGYLEQEAYRGYRVSRISAERVRELATVRVANDMVAIESILKDETGARMVQLDEVLHEYLSRTDKPDPIERHEAHMAFHRGIWEASGNTFMMKLWPVLEAEMTLVLAVEQEQRHDGTRARALHESLVECIRRGDRDEIYENLRTHIVASAEDFLKVFDAEAVSDN
ncbi:GntR family transcriptional regulator [Corynebacterium sp. J010B-136]|uniref:GntR family transcriptional regulator n=1 Tax=Corynebacterium sp. J010B-136 TaxID=2099401 RepID=UPI000CF91488|nr:GntR family transcriptional regulator [Corynebacterium sp. J010B-136]PQM73358.1 GntR family transcriptional regulator [Corynebacterium sp. J010B-136]